MADIVKLKQIAIGSPTSVPAGEYALQALTAAGVYARLAAGKQLVMAKDVHQALTYADRGETDGAFVSIGGLTDVRHLPNFSRHEG